MPLTNTRGAHGVVTHGACVRALNGGSGVKEVARHRQTTVSAVSLIATVLPISVSDAVPLVM